MSPAFTFLTDLDPQAARGLVITMTAQCRRLSEEIRTARTPAKVRIAMAQFQGLNAERVRLVREHGLEGWVVTL